MSDLSNENNEATTDKRAMILKVAVDVFAEFGYQNADVQVIANRANVGKGTVYRYFVNKEQLFWDATLWVMQQWDVFLEPIKNCNASPLVTLRQAALTRAKFLEEHPNCIEMMILQRANFRGEIPEQIKDYMNVHMFEPTLKIIQEGIDQGELNVDDPMSFFFAWCSAVQGAAFTHCFFGEIISLSKMTELAVDTLLNGVLKQTSHQKFTFF